MAYPAPAGGVVPAVAVPSSESYPRWTGLLLSQKAGSNDWGIVSPVVSDTVPPGIELPYKLFIRKWEKQSFVPHGLPSFHISVAEDATRDRKVEFVVFQQHLRQRDKVAIVVVDDWELLIWPPKQAPSAKTQTADVSYRPRAGMGSVPSQRIPQQPPPPMAYMGQWNRMGPPGAASSLMADQTLAAPPGFQPGWGQVARLPPHLDPLLGAAAGSSVPLARSGYPMPGGQPPLVTLPPPPHPPPPPPASAPLIKRHEGVHPTYLKSQAQAHSWVLGALAELIDNSYDAKAQSLLIRVEKLKVGKEVQPVLCVADDGVGMDAQGLDRMLNFGHASNPSVGATRVGRYGMGFKTGSMRVGGDAIIFTVSEQTCSVGMLSTTYNESKEKLEVPAYTLDASTMDPDLAVQSEEAYKANREAILSCSPFNEYKMGVVFDTIRGQDKKGTGTHVYIYNLQRYGDNYELQWDGPEARNDIIVRSRRKRETIPGRDMSRDIPLDYSLRCYLEVLFVDPRMNVYIQGKRVKTRRLACSLSHTVVKKGMVNSVQVTLTLGFDEKEKAQGNRGCFLYWHGRLIEAYRPYGMMEKSDAGLGVIGVIDISKVVGDDVNNNKQSFNDTANLSALSSWLRTQFDEYWDAKFDKYRVESEEHTNLEPDMDWVQCNKCLKWRIIREGFKDLPDIWFCYMNRDERRNKCADPEERPDGVIVNVNVKRSSGLASGASKVMAPESQAAASRTAQAAARATQNVPAANRARNPGNTSSALKRAASGNLGGPAKKRPAENSRSTGEHSGSQLPGVAPTIDQVKLEENSKGSNVRASIGGPQTVEDVEHKKTEQPRQPRRVHIAEESDDDDEDEDEGHGLWAAGVAGVSDDDVDDDDDDSLSEG